MPRTSPIAPSEKLIGSRVRELREGHLLTGTAFAKKFGISSGNLSKYENGWVPLPWTIGNQIAFVENVSQEWLATGALPRGGYLWFEPSFLESIPRRISFSEAFSSYLAPRFQAANRSFRKEGKASKLPKRWFRDAWAVAKEYKERDELALFQHVVATWYNSLSAARRSALIVALDDKLDEFLKRELPTTDTAESTSKAIAGYFQNQAFTPPPDLRG